jgi:exo-beta-1,3-glucanase (GH17 family)
VPHRFRRLVRGWALVAIAAVIVGAATVPLNAADLAGGRRPLPLTLEGRWIGNGVAFSPYRDGQHPDGRLPSDAEILSDLRLVSRYWNLIRMYDASPVAESTIRLIARERLPIRVMLGAWLVGEATPSAKERNRREIATAIRLANEVPNVVLAVSAGNEAGVEWSDHRASADMIAGWVREIRDAIKQPVTCADDYNFWNQEESRKVAAAVDFITLHAYALWNGQPLKGAIAWTSTKYDECVRFHAGIPVIIGETGWATSHDASRTGPGGEGTLMKAEVSVAAQQDYLRQHYRWIADRKVPTFLFEAFDEAWKGGGAATPPQVVEKHWGVFDTARHPKPSFTAIIREFYPASDR